MKVSLRHIITLLTFLTFALACSKDREKDKGASSPSADSCSEISSCDATAHDLLDNLVNSEAKKECDAKGLVFNRQENDCFDEKIDMSWCTSSQSVIKYFNARFETRGKIEEQIKDKMEEGFLIEQCGVSDETPVVTFIKRLPDENRILHSMIRIKAPKQN